MSKELTPLEAFREILFIARSYSSDNVVGYLEKFYKDKLDTVENALKNYEDLTEYIDTLQGDRDYWWNIANKNEKKVKALEIIKKIAKSYDIEFCDNKQSMSFKIELKNKFILETITIKNKEEYDLLKEVLL